MTETTNDNREEIKRAIVSKLLSYLKKKGRSMFRFIKKHAEMIQAIDSSISVAKSALIIFVAAILFVLALFGLKFKNNETDSNNSTKYQTQSQQPQTAPQSNPPFEMNQSNPVNSPQVHGSGNTINYNAQTSEKHSIMPSLPNIRFITNDGLPLVAEKINGAEFVSLKMYQLVVLNPNDVEIFNFCARLQLPEPVSRFSSKLAIQKPVGSNVDWHQIQSSGQVVPEGPRPDGEGPTAVRDDEWFELRTSPLKRSSVELTSPLATNECFKPDEHRPEHHSMVIDDYGCSSGIWELQIDRIPARKSVQIDFLTTQGIEAMDYFSLLAHVPAGSGSEKRHNIVFFIEGNFQYRVQDMWLPRYFFGPLFFNEKDRKLTLGQVRDGLGEWRPLMLRLDRM